MKKEFKVISELILQNSKVLDVGCGDGELMKFLKDNKTSKIRGLEISKNRVQNCLSKGLTVIEGNAENDLQQFPNNSFDFVILSQTLQAFLDPEKVISELLRVGKKAIVTIPNFGYWKVRLNLLIKGTMPVTENLPNEWYNTPNLHMCTLRDFFNFCSKREIKIFKSLALKNDKTLNLSSKNLAWRNIGGNLNLKKKYNAKVIGYVEDKHRIPGIDIELKDKEIWNNDEFSFQVFHIPGHTSGHICFYFKKEKLLFTGDTLFSLGCGRIFEGTYEQMFSSLQIFKNFPKDTKIFCGHEYTMKNAEFCKMQDQQNEKLNKKFEKIKNLLDKGLPTIPTTIEDELDCNIFLKSEDLETFSKLRDLKDNF